MKKEILVSGLSLGQEDPQKQIRYILFVAGLVLWYNHINGREVLRFHAQPHGEYDFPTLWLIEDRDLSDFWSEYDIDRVKKEHWHAFEEEEWREKKRGFVAAGLHPVWGT